MLLRRTASVLLPLLAAVSSAKAQQVHQAAAIIAAGEIRHHLGAIAHDSMGGRDTPSAGLTKTAAWMAQQFREAGLRPSGDNGQFEQRYTLRVGARDLDSAFIEVFDATGARVKVSLGQGLVIAPRSASFAAKLTTAPLVLFGGRVDSTLKREDFAGRVVVLFQDFRTVTNNQIVQAFGTLTSLGVSGILMSVNQDAPPSPQRRATSRAPVEGIDEFPGRGGPFIAGIRENLFAQTPIAAHAAHLRAATAPTVVRLPGSWSARFIDKTTAAVDVQVPNVIGVLPGSDPQLRDEYLVISAHIDHAGERCMADAWSSAGICPGADDNASGTVAIVALAKALARAQPRRSIIFAGFSGEELGRRGSRHFVNQPPVEVARIVGNINLDMIGRNPDSSLIVVGLDESDLGSAVKKAAERPEIALPIAGAAITSRRNSDHASFVDKGIPAVAFTTGLHADYHRPGDTADKIDAERLARVVRLVFHAAYGAAGMPARPKWTDSR